MRTDDGGSDDNVDMFNGIEKREGDDLLVRSYNAATILS